MLQTSEVQISARRYVNPHYHHSHFVQLTFGRIFFSGIGETASRMEKIFWRIAELARVLFRAMKKGGYAFMRACMAYRTTILCPPPHLSILHAGRLHQTTCVLLPNLNFKAKIHHAAVCERYNNREDSGFYKDVSRICYGKEYCGRLTFKNRKLIV